MAVRCREGFKGRGAAPPLLEEGSGEKPNLV